jgi:hypothetical protein
MLKDRGPRRLIGCDIAPRMVQLARRNLGSTAEIVQLHDSQLPFENEEVDLSFTMTVLQHNRDESVQLLLDELTRVTKSHLELIEDVTTFRPRSFGGTYFVRDVNQYISWVTSRGFALEGVVHYHTWVSERVSFAIQRVGRGLTGRANEEGQPITRAEATLERGLLRLTSPLDRRLPPTSGVSALRFRRNS